MPETFARWDMADYIKNLEDARFHLEAAMDEDPGDGSLVRAVLSAIARSQSMSTLARDTGLNRSNLYKALSENGNPSFTTVLKVIRALNLRLRVETRA
jgi:probable addiction module antidote protein